MADKIDYKSSHWDFDGKAHKAGFFIVGDVADAQGKKHLHVLAPWVEGAYSDDGKKMYTIAKGSVDEERDVVEGEETKASLWKTAIHEVDEETNIDLRRIRDPRLGWRERRKPRKGFYEGVEIESVIQTPVFAGMLPSNRGHARGHVIHVVKVKGIENLIPHLKHKDHNEDVTSEVVTKTAAEATKDGIAPDGGKFYGFDELLSVLRSGVWSADLERVSMKSPERIFENVTFDDGSGFYLKKENTAFTDIEERYAKESGAEVPIQTPEQMDEMFQTIPSEDKRKVKECLKALRKFMNEKELVNDNNGLKLGDKHMPLRYYQEGADIMPMETYIQRMVDAGNACQIYRDTQFNPDVISDKFSDGEHKDKITPIVSMARMAYNVATRLDKSPEAAWPSTVIDSATLSDDIAKLEAAAREEQRGRRYFS